MKKLPLLMAWMFAVSAGTGLAGWSASVKLAERTSVRVAILETLVSGQGKPNDEVRFELREDLYGPNREVLAVKGTPAFGHIIRTSRRGMFGRSGKLEFSCDSVKAVDDTKIPLRGTEIKSGKGNGGAAIATALVVSVLGVFINGRDVKVEKGTEFTVYVNEDTLIDPGKSPMTKAGGSETDTYSISVSPSVCKDIAQKAAAGLNASAQSPVVVAISDFELRAEKDSMKLDAAVAHNVCEDMSIALGGISGITVVDHAAWAAAAKGVGIESGNAVDGEKASQAGSMVGAAFVMAGSISDRGDVIVINTRILDVKDKGKTVWTLSTETPKH